MQQANLCRTIIAFYYRVKSNNLSLYTKFFNKSRLFKNIHIYLHFTQSVHTLKSLIWHGLFILSNLSNNEVQIYSPPCNNTVSAFEMSTSEGCVLSESSSMQLAGSLCIWIYWELIYLCILVHSHCVLHRSVSSNIFWLET